MRLLFTALLLVVSCSWGNGDSETVAVDSGPTLNDARIVPFEIVEAAALRAETDGEVSDSLY